LIERRSEYALTGLPTSSPAASARVCVGVGPECTQKISVACDKYIGQRRHFCPNTLDTLE
jgi:hypothetical protein